MYTLLHINTILIVYTEETGECMIVKNSFVYAISLSPLSYLSTYVNEWPTFRKTTGQKQAWRMVSSVYCGDCGP